MKNFIVCSINSVAENYIFLSKLRIELLQKGELIIDDWIERSLIFKNISDVTPSFIYEEKRDYLKEALNNIIASDSIYCIFSKPSSYATTLFRYSIYHKKRIYILYNKVKYIPVFVPKKSIVIQNMSKYVFK